MNRNHRLFLLALVGAGLLLCLAAFLANSAPAPGPLLPESTTQVAASESPTPSPTASPTASPVPTRSPLPDSVTADRIEIPALSIDLPLEVSDGGSEDDFPPDCCAFIYSASLPPGHNTNSYIFAHALENLFKPLWNAELGQEVNITMNNGLILTYVITEIHPNVPCPDPNPPNPELNPEVLGIEVAPEIANATDCSEAAKFLERGDEEMLTLQTSQGYNRNWGELIVIAEPTNWYEAEATPSGN